MTVALIFAAWSLFGSGPHTEQHFSFAVAAPGRVSVDTANGSINVATGRAGSGVAVTAIKRADTLEQVRALSVAADRRGNDVMLHAIYPKDCGARSCGGEISFELTVPPGTRLDLGTSNGHIGASAISADARLETSNGWVSASYAAFTAVKSVALSTSNGAITLSLPASARIGRLHMDTSVGRLSSDWAVNVDRSNFVGASVDQTLRAGGATVTLDTTNGSIALKKI